MRATLAALCLLFLFAAPARADLEQARQFYAAGAFEDAARAGEALGDAAGLSLAAKALLARTLVSETPISAEGLARIEADAARALALDPQSVEARLSLAAALGVKGRRAHIGEALAKGYGPKGKRLIDEALALDPDNARAQAMLGGWHLEVLRRAGPAGRVMGAGFDRGRAAFERAIALAPNNPALRAHYAVALLALDPEKHGARAAVLLAEAAALKPADAFEAAAREEARRIGALLASEGALATAEALNGRTL
jgi:hypothetical protein